MNRQRYLELLEARQTSEALHVLRGSLVPLAPPDTDPDHIHALSRCVAKPFAHSILLIIFQLDHVYRP